MTTAEEKMKQYQDFTKKDAETAERISSQMRKIQRLQVPIRYLCFTIPNYGTFWPPMARIPQFDDECCPNLRPSPGVGIGSLPILHVHSSRLAHLFGRTILGLNPMIRILQRKQKGPQDCTNDPPSRG